MRKRCPGTTGAGTWGQEGEAVRLGSVLRGGGRRRDAEAVGKAHWAEEMKGSVSFDQDTSSAPRQCPAARRPLGWGQLPRACRLLPGRLPKGTPVLLERRSSTGSLAPRGRSSPESLRDELRHTAGAPNASLRDSAIVNQKRALHGDWAQVTVDTGRSGAPDLEERPGHPPSTPFGEPSSCSRAYKWSQEGTQQVQSKQAAQGQPQPLWVPGDQKPQETKRFCPGLSEAEFYAHIYCPPGNFQMHCQEETVCRTLRLIKSLFKSALYRYIT